MLFPMPSRNSSAGVSISVSFRSLEDNVSAHHFAVPTHPLNRVVENSHSSSLCAFSEHRGEITVHTSPSQCFCSLVDTQFLYFPWLPLLKTISLSIMSLRKLGVGVGGEGPNTIIPNFIFSIQAKIKAQTETILSNTNSLLSDIISRIYTLSFVCIFQTNLRLGIST